MLLLNFIGFSYVHRAKVGEIVDYVNVGGISFQFFFSLKFGLFASSNLLTFHLKTFFNILYCKIFVLMMFICID